MRAKQSEVRRPTPEFLPVTDYQFGELFNLCSDLHANNMASSPTGNYDAHFIKSDLSDKPLLAAADYVVINYFPSKRRTYNKGKKGEYTTHIKCVNIQIDKFDYEKEDETGEIEAIEQLTLLVTNNTPARARFKNLSKYGIRIHKLKHDFRVDNEPHFIDCNDEDLSSELFEEVLSLLRQRS
jgi:hypothetical protein